MARRKVSYKGIDYDSDEEVEFAKWLEEATEMGYIQSYIYQPNSFLLSEKINYTKITQLKTKVREDSRELLKKHEYTADFFIDFDRSFFEDFGLVLHPHQIDSTLTEVYIDVKGGFNANESITKFRIDQKWVYDKYKVYVNELVPAKFFQKTWVPESIAWRVDGKGKYARFAKCKTLLELRGKSGIKT